MCTFNCNCIGPGSMLFKDEYSLGTPLLHEHTVHSIVCVLILSTGKPLQQVVLVGTWSVARCSWNLSVFALTECCWSNGVDSCTSWLCLRDCSLTSRCSGLGLGFRSSFSSISHSVLSQQLFFLCRCLGCAASSIPLIPSFSLTVRGISRTWFFLHRKGIRSRRHKLVWNYGPSVHAHAMYICAVGVDSMGHKGNIAVIH